MHASRLALFVLVAFTTCLSTASAALTPIARWDVVPHQRLEAGETLNVGVVAFSKSGIDRVEFRISGQGYSGVTPLVVRSMTRNEQSNVVEYWVPVRVDDFETDGPITIEAKVVGSDGGVRNRLTDGGGVGLDALTLYVNPGGTLSRLEAWVAVTGDDETGVVGERAAPFRSIRLAIRAVEVIQGDVDGAVIHLEAGNHNAVPAGFVRTPNTTREYLTIRAAEGVERSVAVISRASGQGTPLSETEFLRLQGVTLSNRALTTAGWVLAASQSSGYQVKLWIDDCHLNGLDKAASVGPLGGQLLHTYFTGCRLSDYRGLVPWNSFVRGCELRDSSGDAFQRVPMVVDCRIANLDPAYNVPDVMGARYYASGHASGRLNVIEKAGAFADYDAAWGGDFATFPRGMQIKVGGKISNDAIWLDAASVAARRQYLPETNGGSVDGFLSTGDHTDVWQWFKTADGSNPVNTIMYNVRAEGLQYQAIMARPGGGFGAEQAKCVAFVNVFLRFQSPIHRSNGGGGQSLWGYPANHMLLWNVVHVGDSGHKPSFNFYDRDGPANITGLSVKGCCFESLFHHRSQGGSIEESGFVHNHIRNPDAGHSSIYPGVDLTTGDDGLGENTRPSPDSVLLGRIATPSTPSDLTGDRWLDPASIGAFRPVPADSISPNSPEGLRVVVSD